MATLRIQIHATKPMTSRYLKTHYHSISCSMQQQPPQNNIKVVINGAAKEIGMAAVLAVTKARDMEFAGAVDSYLVGEDIGKVVINGAAKEIGMAAVLAVTKARGMEVAGAVDSYLVGEDIGKVCGMEEALEMPIINDLTMVLGSISQSKATSVVVDFTDPSTVYDNVKQATAFGMNSVVYVPRIKPETVAALSAFCEKASMGCLVAPTLSIGSILLQQAAISASFHYKNVEIVESKANLGTFPSQDAVQIANNLTNLGQLYNKDDLATDNPARGQRLGEDGVRVHSLVLPGLVSSTTVHFSGPGEMYSIKHDITNVECLMPGLILAIRQVVRLKNLVYGLEKFL